jgi:hypothetical protein
VKLKKLLILLALGSCARHNVQPKEKSLVGAVVVAGTFLKTAGCYAELKTKNVTITVGTSGEKVTRTSDKSSDDTTTPKKPAPVDSKKTKDTKEVKKGKKR